MLSLLVRSEHPREMTADPHVSVDDTLVVNHCPARLRDIEALHSKFEAVLRRLLPVCHREPISITDCGQDSCRGLPGTRRCLCSQPQNQRRSVRELTKRRLVADNTMHVWPLPGLGRCGVHHRLPHCL